MNVEGVRMQGEETRNLRDAAGKEKVTWNKEKVSEMTKSKNPEAPRHLFFPEKSLGILTFKMTVSEYFSGHCKMTLSCSSCKIIVMMLKVN